MIDERDFVFIFSSVGRSEGDSGSTAERGERSHTAPTCGRIQNTTRLTQASTPEMQ